MLSPRPALLISLVLLPGLAQAHSFGVIYTLPLPFWLYAWGAGAALIASFVVFGLMMSAARPRPLRQGTPKPGWRVPMTLSTALKLPGLALLVLCIATGWWGTPNAYANFNMTAFWIVLLLGLAYLSVLAGDLYAVLNPWRTLCALIARLWPAARRGLLRHGDRFGYLPAVALYMGLIWIELLGNSSPRELAHLLATYTVLNLFGSALLGMRTWFTYWECLSVMFALLARIAPVRISGIDVPEPLQIHLRWPSAGLLEDRPPLSLLLFMVAMLATTAFDGLHETQIWYEFYWLWLYPEWLIGWAGSNPLAAFAKLREGYQWWQAGWLLIFPLFYFAAYAFAILLAKGLCRTALPLTELCRCFAYSLMPIVLVYHLSHYFTLLWTQGPKFLPLLSDPFGRGQDWFGTAQWFARINVPELAWVWNVQVGLIVAGHIASVYVAHLQALRLFSNRRQALLSQIPMLSLMLCFTVAGLWILSQPFQGGR